MKFGVMILVALVIMVFLLKILDVSSFIVNEHKMSDPDIPPTWNLDWQGGPGFDRYKILNEKGPYNPKGFN
jgi:hypothetical protein